MEDHAHAHAHAHSKFRLCFAHPGVLCPVGNRKIDFNSDTMHYQQCHHPILTILVYYSYIIWRDMTNFEQTEIGAAVAQYSRRTLRGPPYYA